MLSISKLHAFVGEKTILNGLTLDVAAGDVHAIMGSDRGIIEKSDLISVPRTF